MAQPHSNTSEQRPRLRRELLIVGIALLAGLILLPLLIYAAGQLTLGPYQNGSLGALLKDFYSALIHGSTAAWGVVLGPYLMLSFLRAILLVSQRYLRA